MTKVGWLLGAAAAITLLPAGTHAERPSILTRSDMPMAPAPPLRAEAQCRVIDVDLNPTPDLQIAVWLERADGTYVDTMYLTQGVATYGLGNRPGIMGMRGGPNWPYGPRLDVFPVWSHRHGQRFPLVFFQNGDGGSGGAPDCGDSTCKSDPDRNLSHPFTQSSREVYYTRPLRPDEPGWDTGTAASAVYTDKGRIWIADSLNNDICTGSGQGSCLPGWECRAFGAETRCQNWSALYPPRVDSDAQAGLDDASVTLYDDINPFDAVSGATPVGDGPFSFTWVMPPELPVGDYVVFVEVSKEFDFNGTYNDVTQPPITASAWNEYGLPYRGQPSVVYRVPFTLGTTTANAVTDLFTGYGDPGHGDGVIRSPDTTMTTDTDGSGALRLGLALDEISGGMYRVRIEARSEEDYVAPEGVAEAEVIRLDYRSADFTFVAPGDDGLTGKVAGYEVRLRASEPITDLNFTASTPVPSGIEPVNPGDVQSFTIDTLLPLTHYYIGIRAYDECRNYGPLVVLELDTPDREVGAVDACFVATAAYGSLMVNDVAMLRRFRDNMLRTNVLGELAVEAYYTFGPGLAGVIGESELLRETARTALEPVVDYTRTLSVSE